MCIFIPFILILLLGLACCKGMIEDREFIGYSTLLFIPVVIMVLVYILGR